MRALSNKMLLVPQTQALTNVCMQQKIKNYLQFTSKWFTFMMHKWILQDFRHRQIISRGEANFEDSSRNSHKGNKKFRKHSIKSSFLFFQDIFKKPPRSRVKKMMIRIITIFIKIIFLKKEKMKHNENGEMERENVKNIRRRFPCFHSRSACRPDAGWVGCISWRN